MFDYKKIGAMPITLAFLSVVITFFLYSVLPKIFDSASTLRIGNGVFNTQIIKNSDQMDDVLSKLSKIESDQAFIVIFPKESKWKINTKNMQIPVDIIWVSNDKKIVDISKNTKPADITVVPKVSAKYVIELPSGTVDKNIIIANSMAIFQTEELISN